MRKERRAKLQERYEEALRNYNREVLEYFGLLYDFEDDRDDRVNDAYDKFCRSKEPALEFPDVVENDIVWEAGGKVDKLYRQLHPNHKEKKV